MKQTHMKTEFCERLNSLFILLLCISYSLISLLKKNFEENMQDQEIDRDLFNTVPSSLMLNFHEILRSTLQNLNFFEITP
jgi:hypothetical protein